MGLGGGKSPVSRGGRPECGVSNLTYLPKRCDCFKIRCLMISHTFHQKKTLLSRPSHVITPTKFIHVALRRFCARISWPFVHIFCELGTKSPTPTSHETFYYQPTPHPKPPKNCGGWSFSKSPVVLCQTLPKARCTPQLQEMDVPGWRWSSRWLPGHLTVIPPFLPGHRFIISSHLF